MARLRGAPPKVVTEIPDYWRHFCERNGIDVDAVSRNASLALSAGENPPVMVAAVLHAKTSMRPELVSEFAHQRIRRRLSAVG